LVRFSVVLLQQVLIFLRLVILGNLRQQKSRRGSVFTISQKNTKAILKKTKTEPEDHNREGASLVQ
jgi:hypothetical protein